MPRKSTVKRLPPELLAEVNRLLTEDRMTLDELLTHLRGLGVDSVSRSALGRHKQRVDAVVDKLRQSREAADAIVSRLGPDAAEGRQGRALVQMVNAMVCQYAMRRLSEPDGELEVAELQRLARTVKESGQAARSAQDFELKLREQVEKEVLAKMEDAAKAVDGEALTPAQAFEKVRALYRGEA